MITLRSAGSMRRLAASLLLVALVGGCTSYNKTVDVAIQKYQGGNVDGALDDLRTVEGHESKLNARWTVRYLLWRGLAHLSMFRSNGYQEDRDAARGFLVEGLRRYETGNRAYLSVVEERNARAALAYVDSAGLKPASAGR